MFITGSFEYGRLLSLNGSHTPSTETSEPVSTGETALSQSAVVEPLADKPATAQTPSTSSTPVSSSTTTPASSSTNTPASAATASCVAAVIEEVESDQNRRRRKILQEEMNWRKKVELLGGKGGGIKLSQRPYISLVFTRLPLVELHSFFFLMFLFMMREQHYRLDTEKDESLRNFHWCLIRTLHNYPLLV